MPKADNLLPSLLWMLLAAAGGSAIAEPSLPTGERQITLVSSTGERARIGRVTFTPDGEARTITVNIDSDAFRDEFLSMRPFRCLSGTKELWCHLPYPYELRGRITASDLTDLEYSLLFLFKPPTGYGIDAWNGLYFRLALSESGAVRGVLNDVNLDILAAPPDDKLARTITASDLTPAEPGSHRFATVVIE